MAKRCCHISPSFPRSREFHYHVLTHWGRTWLRLCQTHGPGTSACRGPRGCPRAWRRRRRPPRRRCACRATETATSRHPCGPGMMSLVDLTETKKWHQTRPKKKSVYFNYPFQCPTGHSSCHRNWWRSGCRRGNDSTTGSPCGRAVPGWRGRCPRASWGCISNRCCRDRRTPRSSPTGRTRRSSPMMIVMELREPADKKKNRCLIFGLWRGASRIDFTSLVLMVNKTIWEWRFTSCEHRCAMFWCKNEGLYVLTLTQFDGERKFYNYVAFTNFLKSIKVRFNLLECHALWKYDMNVIAESGMSKFVVQQLYKENYYRCFFQIYFLFYYLHLLIYKMSH